MSHGWLLQDAKNRFSEVVNEAQTRGPQVITRRGIAVAVLISYADYTKLKKSKGKLSQFFRSSPLAGLQLDRDTSSLRDINI